MRRITLLVAAVAAYTLLGMALASATILVDKDADWAPVETTHYKCPGDDMDDVRYGAVKLLSDTGRRVIVIASLNYRKGVRLPVIRVDTETGTVTFNGRRCRPDIRPGE